MSIQNSDYDLFNNRVVPTPTNITLTGSYTLANPTGTFADATRLIWRLKQDATGSRAVTLGSQFRIPTSGTSPLPFSTAPNATDVLAAMYNLADNMWDVVSFVPGY